MEYEEQFIMQAKDVVMKFVRGRIDHDEMRGWLYWLVCMFEESM